MNQFFAVINRMKFINRWGLMHNTRTENLSEHSADVAITAHALAVIGNQHFGKSINAEHVAVVALFHDASEIFTGDLPTPVKYYNGEIKNAYKQVEHIAEQKLISYLPANLQPQYQEIICCEAAEVVATVKAADKICAYIKCIDELKMGNSEFASAKKTLLKAIEDIELPEVKFFMSEFSPAYECTLDESID